MGVSIGWQPMDPEPRWLDIGWRSMMHQLLLDNGLYGRLDRDDIPLLRKIGRTQYRGVKEPPFDHADDIQKAFEDLIRAIRKYDVILVTYAF
jgi:hypothetical protein